MSNFIRLFLVVFAYTISIMPTVIKYSLLLISFVLQSEYYIFVRIVCISPSFFLPSSSSSQSRELQKTVRMVTVFVIQKVQLNVNKVPVMFRSAVRRITSQKKKITIRLKSSTPGQWHVCNR